LTNSSFLVDVRNEIEQSNLVQTNGSNHVISISKLKTRCPSLVSAFREYLRFYASNSSIRLVLEDTILADKYLLKKGHKILVAGNVIHFDLRIWGADAEKFDPLQFIDSPSGTIKSQSTDEPATTVHAAAFRGFGGGTNLCPGHHFAQAEIIGFAVMIILGWEMLPSEGELKMLEVMLPLGILKPDGDVVVRMQRRKGFEDVQWSFEP
jgi:cytochrome P450